MTRIGANASRVMGVERKVVLVTRRTRLAELIDRHGTLGQARFYVEHLGADFDDYLLEHAAYTHSLQVTVHALEAWGRYQSLERQVLPNFVFSPTDIVIALGQDGLVANTMKYLSGQPLIGVNPEPSRWDGLLLPFTAEALSLLLPQVAAGQRRVKAVTIAEARLADGQTLRGVNDLFIGPRSHTSALYEINYRGQSEFQSSSGLIVSTGLGSTAWMKSVLVGAQAITESLGLPSLGSAYQPTDWDTQSLEFAVREPFPSRNSKANLVYGKFGADQPLRIRSRMPENGVIFSDGIESDFLRFTAGMEATIGISDVKGQLVV